MYAHEPSYRNLPAAARKTITLPSAWGAALGSRFASPGLGLTAQDVLGGFSLQTLMIGSLAAWVAYSLFFTSGAKKRRSEIAEARKRHAEEIKAIREKYA